MRKSGITVALLPEKEHVYELVEVTDITPKSITIKVHDEVRTYSHDVEEQGKWCVRGFLDFRQSELLNAE